MWWIVFAVSFLTSGALWAVGYMWGSQRKNTIRALVKSQIEYLFEPRFFVGDNYRDIQQKPFESAEVERLSRELAKAVSENKQLKRELDRKVEVNPAIVVANRKASSVKGYQYETQSEACRDGCCQW